MKLHTWFALPAVIGAFVAGRETAPRVEARPVEVPVTHVATAVPVVRCPAAPALEADAGEDVEPDDPDAIDVAQTEALRMLTRIAALESSLGAQGALRGQIRDPTSGEALAGVTVVAYRGDESHAAITDETGWYELAPLAPDTYTVVLYFLDRTSELRYVSVESRRITSLHGSIASSQDPPVIEDLGHGFTIDPDYIREIETQRHYEDPDAPAEGGAAEGVDEGITFSGETSVVD